MGRIVKIVFMAMVAALTMGVCHAEEKAEGPILTHADASVILAKYSGYFDRYVAEDADLNTCVSFLNRTGIYFGLLEVVNGSMFTTRDCAKALGQINLALSGEAEYSSGKIKLPSGVDSWENYCTLNRVDYIGSYRTMLEMLRTAYERTE